MSIKPRLILMNFLQFGVWGAYLTSMGGYLAQVGLGEKIWLFFAIQGIVSIFMPAIMGIFADKVMPAQRVLSLSHALAGLFMIGAGVYAMATGEAIQFGTFFLLYTVSVTFYMPTIAISNSVAYNALEKSQLDPVKHFPPIRVFGTIGFICCMLAVNFIKNGQGVQFQHSYEQFFLSGALSLVLCVYALTMPNCPCNGRGVKGQSFAETLGLNAFKLFREPRFAIFFIFSMFLGASLQITNGYANSFITHFESVPEFANTWGAHNANALISLSQISETLCILLIPFCMKKFGIKKVMLMSMFAWVLRFGLFGLGDTGSGLWMLMLSCVVYGVAFDFFNISGSLYVDQNTDSKMRSSAQGLFMLMTNGLGATFGTWAAGMVVNHFVYGSDSPSWSTAWLIFAAYAMVVTLLFAVLFKERNSEQVNA
ncbi:MAG: MFS transporter [Bacteroidales bacterium]|nr:MFS transporter [Bacteroidales bacterium]